MNRLTENSKGTYCNIINCDAEPEVCGGCESRQVYEKLKKYEDTGASPDEIVTILNQYSVMIGWLYPVTVGKAISVFHALAENRVVVLPAKVGQRVFGIGYGCVEELTVSSIVYEKGSDDCIADGGVVTMRRDDGTTESAHFSSFGHLWFTTYEDAARALRGNS